MGKVEQQELFPSVKKKRNKYGTWIGVRTALESCSVVDEDYAKILMNYAYHDDGDSPSYEEVEGLGNDRELEIHGVEKGQVDVRGECELDFESNASKNRVVEKQNKMQKNGVFSIHGVEKGQVDVRGECELDFESNASKNRAVEKQKKMQKYGALEIHGVEKGQVDVSGECELVLESNARKNRIVEKQKKMQKYGVLEIHGVEKGQVDVRGECELDFESNARKNRVVEKQKKMKKDGVLEIHGVEKGQVDVRGDCELDFESNAQKNRIVEKQKKMKKNGVLEIHGVKKGQVDVRGECKLDFESNASKNRVVEKQKKMKNGILSKKRGNEERDLDNSIVEKQKKMKDGILSNERVNQDRDLDNRIDVKIVSDKEQTNLNGSKFMDARVKIEPKEESDSLEEAISQGEVEILENFGAEVGCGSSSSPFVPSVMDATIIDCGYRKKVLNLLMRPYDDEEYKKLWRDIKMQLPSSSTNGRGKSLLSRHKVVNRKIKKTNHDKDKKLNIMRGFFFWLEHLTRQDAFQPWEDEECLQMMPGSS